MAYRKVFDGDGIIIHGDSEVPANYHIIAEKTHDLISASGTVEVDPRHFVELFETATPLQLRLSSGEVVDILFLGGNIDGPAKISVNSRMPGF